MSAAATSALECLIRREPLSKQQQQYIETLVRCQPVQGEEPVILSIPYRDHERFQKQRYALIYENQASLRKGQECILQDKEIKSMLKIKETFRVENVAFILLNGCMRINAFVSKIIQHVFPLPVMVLGFDKKTLFIEKASQGLIQQYYQFDWNSYKPLIQPKSQSKQEDTQKKKKKKGKESNTYKDQIQPKYLEYQQNHIKIKVDPSTILTKHREDDFEINAGKTEDSCLFSEEIKHQEELSQSSPSQYRNHSYMNSDLFQGFTQKIEKDLYLLLRMTKDFNLKVNSLSFKQ